MNPDAERDTTCPVCGGSLHIANGPRTLVKRGALVMRSDPVEFEWNGQPVPLSPMELNLMVALMLRGRATMDEIGALLPQASRRVVIHKIRAKFHLIGAADPIQTIPNWGLKLRIEADRDGTKSIWIGTDESSEEAPFPFPVETPPLTKKGLAEAGLLAPPGARLLHELGCLIPGVRREIRIADSSKRSQPTISFGKVARIQGTQRYGRYCQTNRIWLDLSFAERRKAGSPQNFIRNLKERNVTFRACRGPSQMGKGGAFNLTIPSARLLRLLRANASVIRNGLNAFAELTGLHS